MAGRTRHLVLKFGVNRVEIDTLRPVPTYGESDWPNKRKAVIAEALREAGPLEEPFFMGRKRAFYFFTYEGAEYALDNVKNLMEDLISRVKTLSVPIDPKCKPAVKHTYEYGRNLYRYAQFVAEAAEFLLGGG